MTEWIATMLLWIGHHVPAIGQHMGAASDTVWIDLGPYVFWLTF